MIERVEELGAKLDVLSLRHLEFLAQLPIECILSGTDQAVARCIAKPKSVVREHGKSGNVEPVVGRALAAGQVSIPQLIGPGNPLRAGVGWIIRLERGKWESAGQCVDATDPPSSKHRVHYSIVQMGMAAAKRDLVIETQHPSQLLIEVGHSSFGAKVVAVLREGRCAADLRQIVDGLAVGKRA